MDDNFIEGIFVDQEFRSHGVGKHLLDFVKDIYPQLELSVYKKNKRAISFYLKNNFNKVSEELDPDTNEIDYTMQWEK
ncbi:GNAT family N-acetyltransferase [Pediococcus argentinicus]|uniref:GNAT family N-acetyltransferase n=1 Tax=Pediococcus argentinicus TaxID=480391 RepID=UPI00339004ED